LSGRGVEEVSRERKTPGRQGAEGINWHTYGRQNLPDLVALRALVVVYLH
jgi:hypothetical protein